MEAETSLGEGGEGAGPEGGTTAGGGTRQVSLVPSSHYSAAGPTHTSLKGLPLRELSESKFTDAKRF